MASILGGCRPSTSARPPVAPAVVAAPAPPPPPRTLTPADIAAKALPAVVTIRTGNNLGTGFVVRPDGWIATNLHVIASGALQAKVTLRSERQLDVVEVLAASPEHDLALLRVEERGLPALKLGDSDAMRPGDPVVAIGNPLGLEDTVSNGLVSARRKAGDGVEVLQISAPIAPGSSGGPIFNDQGEVIGIAVAILEQGQNLNFGVPARYLVSLMKDPAPIAFAQFARIIAEARRESAPHVERHVPRVAPSFLTGCSADAQKLIVRMLGEAIDAGAPLYNRGHAGACYHVYDGTAADLIRHLPASCGGPIHLLAEGQKHAAASNDPQAQAWAMRDAFDAVLEAILRSRPR